ncbi:MAG: bifunctional diaminohydroxyphosphoribosylaminopyrimidine deaminase/5-amino-6-(5-phosphoribosylamino)uracil reductase RibD [Planctomycetota bacterium]
MASERDDFWMRQALEFAVRGRGAVEPNPLVGCVIVSPAAEITTAESTTADRLLGAGWHQRFGGPHAEIEALRAVAGANQHLLPQATLYVTLEPCCHHGKTPPCVEALLEQRVRRVVIGMQDPFPAVAGGGIRRLQEAGIVVDLGILESAVRKLNAPYLTRVTKSRPWFIAKWAQTLDGKIATRSGDSRWISQPASRAVVHELRGRMDAIVVGRGTVVQDDPLLTARPPGPRTATRVVLDHHAQIPLDCQLVRTARTIPTLIMVAPSAPGDRLAALQAQGCDVWQNTASGTAEELPVLAAEMARRGWTNVLLESGPTLLGAFQSAGLIDEVHVFVAPKLIGGAGAASAIGGAGIEQMADAWQLDDPQWRILDGDAYVTGHVQRA